MQCETYMRAVAETVRNVFYRERMARVVAEVFWKGEEAAKWRGEGGVGGCEEGTMEGRGGQERGGQGTEEGRFDMSNNVREYTPSRRTRGREGLLVSSKLALQPGSLH